MSSPTVDNQDLQTYLDSFNKEIEEESGNASVLTSVPVHHAFDEAIDSTESISDEDSVAEESDDSIDKEDSMYFVDQQGNYYIQSPKDSLDTLQQSKLSTITRKSIPARTSTDISAAKTSYSKNSIEDDDDDLSYVFILDNNTEKQTHLDVANDVEDDDNEKEIYEFAENDDDDEDEENKDFVIAGKVIRLRSNSGSDRNDISHRCFHCPYTTNKRYMLSRHMKAHSDERPYKCSVCERGFKTNTSLLNHVNTHLGKKPHACKSCDMCFTTSGELVRHIRYRHTGEKPHKCAECDYSSVELSKLRRHMRCHTGERPYQCPHCTYASPDAFKLKRHMRTHTGEKPYECDICHARFTQSNSLKAHRLIHSVGDKPIFQCALCPTTCGRKSDLRLHVQKLHHSDNPITCKRCGKNLPDRYSYKVHIKTHEGEKCYRCQICPYASTSMRHLETHMLIHTDQKPFICQYCDVAFRQRQLLKRHINLSHNKDYVPPTPREKIHSCPHCNRSFSHKGNLMRHMEMHDPESNAHQEKLKLKMGRLTRVQSDGSVVNDIVASKLSDDILKEDEQDDEENFDISNVEEYEVIETLEDELEQKPIIMHNSSDDTINEDAIPQIKTMSIKKEPDCKEFMAVDVGDGQQYMVVEVIQCEEEEENEGEKCPIMNNCEMENNDNQDSGDLENITCID